MRFFFAEGQYIWQLKTQWFISEMLLKQFFPYLCRFNCAAMENNNSPIPLSQAVEAIKTAILQGQYEALKDVNRVQLAVYFAIGKYLSKNTRKGVWGLVP